MKNIFDSIRNFLKKNEYSDIGIDLGTANTIIYVKGKGNIINEPSYVSYNHVTETIEKIGNEAKKMEGRTPVYSSIIRPLKNGVISNYEITEEMISHFLNEIKNEVSNKSRVIICIPSGVTQVEKRAVIDVVKGAGAKKIYLVEEPIAAAIGANIDIFEPLAHLIIDIGGGTTEIAFIVSGGAAATASIKIAGDHINENIIEYIREKKRLLIGEQTAEMLKIDVNNDDDPNKEYLIKGKEFGSGLPKEEIVTKEDIDKAIYKLISNLIYNIKDQLEKVTPEIASDIYVTGIYLSGGGAYIKQLSERIENELNLKVHIVSEPLYAVINGVAQIYSDFNKYANILLES